MKDRDIVAASEVGEFVYCKKCWWKRFLGIEAPNQEFLDAGIKAHNSLSSSVSFVKFLKIVLIVLVGILILLGFVLVIFWL